MQQYFKTNIMLLPPADERTIELWRRVPVLHVDLLDNKPQYQARLVSALEMATKIMNYLAIGSDELNNYIKLYSNQADTQEDVLRCIMVVNIFYSPQKFALSDYEPIINADEIFKLVLDNGVEYVKRNNEYSKIATIRNGSISLANGQLIDTTENFLENELSQAFLIDKNGEKIPLSVKVSNGDN